MKKLLLISIALLMVASSYALEYEPTWRRADWAPISRLYITSFAVDDYTLLRKNKDYEWTVPPADLKRSVLSRDAFVKYMVETFKKKYPKGGEPIIPSYMNLKNRDATMDSFKDSPIYHSNIVFISGHGNQQTLAMSDELVDIGYKAFGGDIKWVFIDACDVLNVNKDGKLDKGPSPSYRDEKKYENLKKAFIGAHAILGYYSQSWEFPQNSNANANYNSELRYKYFAKNFIEKGMTVWKAYYTAHKEYYEEVDNVYFKSNKKHIDGFEPAIAYIEGTDQYGRSHDASTETIDKTYEVAMDPRNLKKQKKLKYDMSILCEKYGVPKY